MDHAGHESAFRDRFWVTLALAVPVVFFSEMFQMLLDYEAPDGPGGRWIPECRRSRSTSPSRARSAR